MRRGMSIVEVLLAAGLLLVLGVLFLEVLLPAVRASHRGTVQAHQQQRAALAMQQLRAELEKSAPAGVSVASDGTGTLLGLMRLQAVTPDARQVWETELQLYYLDREAHRLMHKRWVPPPPYVLNRDRASRFPAEVLGLALLELDGSERIVASNVAEFEVTHQGDGLTILQPLVIRLVMEEEVPQLNGPQRFELTRSVYLRNDQ